MLSLRGLGILNYENAKLSGETHFLEIFFEKYKKDIVVFDVGANIGNYSRMIRELSKEAKVLAFEPHPETYRDLEKNAKQYNFTAYNLGCGEKEGKFKLHDHAELGSTSHATFLQNVIESIHGGISVENEAMMVTLDQFLLRNPDIKKIALLKIDAEGCDFMVLKGAERIICEKMVDVIQFEFNDINVISRVFMKDFYDFLIDYNFYRLLPDGLIKLGKYDTKIYEIFAFQNIVAIRKDLNFDI